MTHRVRLARDRRSSVYGSRPEFEKRADDRVRTRTFAGR